MRVYPLFKDGRKRRVNAGAGIRGFLIPLESVSVIWHHKVWSDNVRTREDEGMIMQKGFWRLPGKLALVAAVVAAGQACAKSDDLHTEENNYGHYCSSCHGKDGKGTGGMGMDMPVRPTDHTDGQIMSTRTDEMLFKIISEGGEAAGFDAGMPAYKKMLRKEEIQGLVKYIRKLCNCKHAG